MSTDGPKTASGILANNFDIQSYSIDNLGAQYRKQSYNDIGDLPQTPFIMGARTAATIRGRNPHKHQVVEGSGDRTLGGEEFMETSEDSPEIEFGGKKI